MISDFEISGVDCISAGNNHTTYSPNDLCQSERDVFSYSPFRVVKCSESFCKFSTIKKFQKVTRYTNS